MEIGVQFYTLKDFCKDLDGFSDALKKVADIGYKNVQISGTCEYEAEWLSAELKKNDLKCVITHTAPAKLLADAEKVAKEHDIFDCKNVGLGFFNFETDKVKEQFEDFKKTYAPIVKTLKENGKYFMYHNHAHEFMRLDGKPVLECIADFFSSEELGITLDTYWVQHAGGDPAAWLERFNGRVPCIHLKDRSFDGKMMAIGEGNINFDRVFKKAEIAGTKHMLVEQDDCNGENPFDCLKTSYDFLKSRGFK